MAEVGTRSACGVGMPPKTVVVHRPQQPATFPTEAELEAQLRDLCETLDAAIRGGGARRAVLERLKERADALLTEFERVQPRPP
jgi:hypothetical protein